MKIDNDGPNSPAKRGGEGLTNQRNFNKQVSIMKKNAVASYLMWRESDIVYLNEELCR